MTVVGEAASAVEAVEAARRSNPDVVIMDVRLPGGTGIEACREIRAEQPDTRVIMLTSYPDEEAVFASIVAGASGYLLKEAGRQVLFDAIATVARGASLLDPSVTGKILERIRKIGVGGADELLSQLSAKEQRILSLIADGKTNKEIAAIVCLSDKTVKNYVSSILGKLNLSHRSAAAALMASKLSQRRFSS